MLKNIAITSADIVDRVKLSAKIPEIIEEILTEKIIVEAFAATGMEVDTAELQKEANRFRLAHQLDTAEDTWKWLKKYQLSFDDFERIIYTKVITRQLADSLFANKVERYFFERQLDYSGVVLYEIILQDEDLALELFYAISENEVCFHDVAREYIQDRELRRLRGYRGVANRKDLKPEISAVVFAAKPPQVLKPIKTSSGIHLILVEEIIQAELDEQISSKILSDLFSRWLETQKKSLRAGGNIQLCLSNN
ncbi:MAG: peptidylprolyl isomerase [Prochloraceae cyanobacterium]|nr:peptidylprolyl isomerase [Prochloraceae cyanobacterium]